LLVIGWGLRGCGVVVVGWGGTNERTPFFIRYEREKMGGLVFSPLVLSIIDYSSVYSKFAWVITFVKSLTLFF